MNEVEFCLAIASGGGRIPPRVGEIGDCADRGGVVFSAARGRVISLSSSPWELEFWAFCTMGERLSGFGVVIGGCVE